MGFDPESMLASFVVSSLGFILFRYGRKQSRTPQTLVGISMLVYPYFVSSVAWMLVICALLLVLLWLLVHFQL